jgi:hypothetical protein
VSGRYGLERQWYLPQLAWNRCYIDVVLPSRYEHFSPG